MQYLVEELVVAASQGDTDRCRELVAQGAEIDYQTTKFRLTALARAAHGGHLNTCKVLLELGADIHKTETGFWTPLHKAAGSGHDAICALFLDKGADIHAQSLTRESPLNCAVSNKHTSTSILLLDRGANIEARDSANRTPLIQACSSTNYELTEELLKRGALTEPRDFFNQTALMMSLHHPRCATAAENRGALLLLAYGADAWDADESLKSLTPIQAAAKGGFNERLMELLSNESAIPNAAGSGACIHGLRQLAMEAGHRDTVAALDSKLSLLAIQRIRMGSQQGAAPVLG